MKVTLVAPEPVPPNVRIEMGVREAKLLMAVLGMISGGYDTELKICGPGSMTFQDSRAFRDLVTEKLYQLLYHAFAGRVK